MFWKKKTVEEPQLTQREIESNAKFVIKRELRNIQKQINEFNKSIEKLCGYACVAKKRGLSKIYNQVVGQIAIIEGKKNQLEAYIAQVEVMQEMGSSYKNSENLVESIETVNKAFSGLNINPKTIEDSANKLDRMNDFMEDQSNLIDDMQESYAYTRDYDSEFNIDVSLIEQRINNMMESGVAESIDVDESDISAQLEQIKKSLNS